MSTLASGWAGQGGILVPGEEVKVQAGNPGNGPCTGRGGLGDAGSGCHS